MKFFISFLIACLIFLTPFFYGYNVGKNAYETVAAYSETDLTKEETEEMEKAVEVHEQMTNISKEKVEEVLEYRQKYPEQALPLFTYILAGNLKRILTSLLSLGISFIPTSYRSGMWIGYFWDIGIYWWSIIILEFLSYVLFGTFIYYLLLNLFTLKRKKRRIFVIKSISILIAAFILLAVSAYLEVVLIQLEI